MRASVFCLGLALLVAVPVALATGGAQHLWASGRGNLLVAVVLAPVAVMVGAALFPDT